MTGAGPGASPPRRDLPVCPRCGGSDVVPVVRGLPDPELTELARRGEVALGGCIVSGEDPDLACRSCGGWFRSDPGPRPGR